MDADHLDIYDNKESLKESFYDFANNIKAGGTLLLHESLEAPADFSEKIAYYGEGKESDFTLKLKSIAAGKQIFKAAGFDKNFEISMAGRHNLLNATAAIAVAKIIGIEEDKISNSVANYSGVKRRFELIAQCADHILIDDYAHHPTEIRAAISATKEMYEGRKITGIFQPHLFSRTRDFADEFAQELSKLDQLVLLEIYPAREKPIEGINSQMLLNKVTIENKILISKEELSEYISHNATEVTLMMGAGDINKLVIEISETLCK